MTTVGTRGPATRDGRAPCADGPRGDLRLRAMGPHEVQVLRHVFAGLSERSRHRRFHVGTPTMSRAMESALMSLDGLLHHAVVAEVALDGPAEPVGVGRVAVTSPHEAEIALEVVDAWQRRGVGQALLEALVDHAASVGTPRLTALVQPDNRPMQRLLTGRFPGAEVHVEDGACTVVVDLTAHGPRGGAGPQGTDAPALTP